MEFVKKVKEDIIIDYTFFIRIDIFANDKK